jgi:hypothetical protein
MKYGLFDEIRNCGKFCFRAIRQNRMTLGLSFAQFKGEMDKTNLYYNAFQNTF